MAVSFDDALECSIYPRRLRGLSYCLTGLQLPSTSTGIYNHYIDLSKKELAVVGWADPERIVKAIRKTRKIITICSHTEHTNPSKPAPEAANASPIESSPP
ncbi:hypothetical protein GIB67_012234 [Kingdonia uniflora]|uniref:Uncharacterized protein n=1 Tax=Kingdonia uniflora TaxID=39325 RepID=A0A7J7M9C3_9MAGN|nr:hypothetical protein GIB67_012234 [Kingdonia uniflora]